MNVNWKEAILQAQKKIDQVLDIRPETVAVEEIEVVEDDVEQNSSTSPVQEFEPLGDDIVMLEPVLPPFLNNRYIGDDIQTIVSSDIEHLTRASSRTASPDRIQIPTSYEKESFVPALQLTPVPVAEVILPNPEDILNEAISGLRKELTEYKKANRILQNSQANLEREMEESRFRANEKVVTMLNEERENFNQEISLLKITSSQALSEKLDFEQKYKNSETTLTHTLKVLENFRNQITQIKTSLQKTEQAVVSDLKNFDSEIRRALKSKVKQANEIKMKEAQITSKKESDENHKVVVKHEAASQTNLESQDISQNEDVQKDNSPTTLVPKSNVTDLLQIIEQLEMEKNHLLLQRKFDQKEIEKLRDQLNETLVMHGEKIEQLDEVLVDNEELKQILKQQALALTKQ
ncbi:unnamed protein product [Caenorhabditis brenneri]